MAQGDSELDGTGIETSVTGKFKITLHKKGKLPAKVAGLTGPILENANEVGVTNQLTFATVSCSREGATSADGRKS